MPICPIEHHSSEIQNALRHATRETLFFMITEQEDCKGSEPSPPGLIRHSDGHLSPIYGSSDYEKALISLTQYVLHASYVIDAWRGKPKGTSMDVIYEGIKVQECQYEVLTYVAKGLAKTISENNLAFDYYIADPQRIESGSGYPDFYETGRGAAVSTLNALGVYDSESCPMSEEDAAVQEAMKNR